MSRQNKERIGSWTLNLSQVSKDLFTLPVKPDIWLKVDVFSRMLSGIHLATYYGDVLGSWNPGSQGKVQLSVGEFMQTWYPKKEDKKEG